MINYPWKSKIKSNLFILHILGMWPKGEGSYKFGLYYLFSTLLLLVFILGHIFVQSINVYLIRKDLALVTGTVYVLFVEMILVFKVYSLRKNIPMVKQLLKILETKNFQPRTEIQIASVDENIWVWSILYRSFAYSSLVINLVWIGYGMIRPGPRQLPFLAWYPFDTSTSPNFELTYIHQVTSTAITTTVHVSIDGLIAALNTFNASQFDILYEKLRNLDKLGNNVSKSIIQCIEHHIQIVSFAEKSNGFLNWILFIQFFVSSFTIGITMFQLTLVTPMSADFFTLFGYGIAITVQIFMYCWFGNEVEFKSSRVAYAIFECDWIDYSIPIKRNLLFLTLRLQKPVQVSALNLFYLSINTFLRIIKTSWSYFAVLHQVTLRQ